MSCDMSKNDMTRNAARIAVVLAAAGGGFLATDSVEASQILARNATRVTLAVDGRGVALITYRDRGRVRRVLAWGATNAAVRFRVDYSGGWRTSRRPVWKRFKNRCRLYDGPPLAWLVKACKAPDGSYWALQAWQRMLPNQGYRPWKPIQSAWELHLSHWRGPLPVLEIYLDWVFGGRFHHLFGRYAYLGRPVHGFRTTSTGIPLDPYGRNIYLDVFDSALGSGWKRENSFLAHRPNGNFCYGFYPRPSYYDDTRRPAAHGRRYRATAIGPGVAPDVFWTGDGLGSFDAEHERRMNELGGQIAGGDRLCRQH